MASTNLLQIYRRQLDLLQGLLKSLERSLAKKQLKLQSLQAIDLGLKIAAQALIEAVAQSGPRGCLDESVSPEIVASLLDKYDLEHYKTLPLSDQIAELNLRISNPVDFEDEKKLKQLRRAAQTLGIPWHPGIGWGTEMVDALDVVKEYVKKKPQNREELIFALTMCDSRFCGLGSPNGPEGARRTVSPERLQEILREATSESKAARVLAMLALEVGAFNVYREEGESKEAAIKRVAQALNMAKNRRSEKIDMP